MQPQEPKPDQKRELNRKEKRALQCLSRSKRALQAYQNRTKTPTGGSR